MGIMDTLKAKLSKDKASDLAQKHGDKIDQGLDRAGKTADQKTQGKHSDQIQTGTSKAKDAMDRFGGPGQDKGGSSGGGATPPPPPAS
ncbi:antitoxin [Streptomyces sp. NPDC058695]|uniref:antitoxin n=1 Tax=Streptomyces sp. NPDC058695 TaxID=3346604 RepID=UPI0036602349